MKVNRKLKMGMVGGGIGAFIGDVHRKASRMDGEIELVAGAFDINPKLIPRRWASMLYVDPARTYGDYKEMIKAESALPEGERIDFVAVTTPNNWHFPIARDFLKAGFHVMCEKPMTLTSKEAKELQKLVKKNKLVFGLMHNYTGLSDGQAGQGHGRQERLWARSARSSCSTRKAGWPPRSKRAARCRPVGEPTRSRAAPAVASVTSARMRPTWPSTSPA